MLSMASHCPIVSGSLMFSSGEKMHKEFVTANPSRHCKGSTMDMAGCLICGNNCKPGIVYCEGHKGTRFYGSISTHTVGWGNKEFYPQLYAHPEFNGAVPPEHLELTHDKLCDSEWIADVC